MAQGRLSEETLRGPTVAVPAQKDRAEIAACDLCLPGGRKMSRVATKKNCRVYERIVGHLLGWVSPSLYSRLPDKS